MKTTKIISIIAMLNVILFMSITSVALPTTKFTGEGEKNNANRISAIKNNIDAAVSAANSENEFARFRFDVASFISGGAETDIIISLEQKLRFDVRNFMDAQQEDSQNLPLASEFEYLRFDAANFSSATSAENTEIPANEFDYLRFDVTKFSVQNQDINHEMPAVK